MGAATVENSMAVLQKVKNGSTYIQKNWSVISERYPHTHIQSSIIHSSQEVETSHVSISGLTATVYYLHTTESSSGLERKTVLSCHVLLRVWEPGRNTRTSCSGIEACHKKANTVDSAHTSEVSEVDF